MAASLCIHGHFYQPPREDPWLGDVLVEASAAPMRNWNERILRESYAPLAWARRLDAEGRITELLNCYEWISFNVGPTLMHWMRKHAPETLERMRAGDALSQERLGYGNAIAQCYHHTIMPLATERDKILETAWAIEDFRYHFGRTPEGMWLPECAVDTPSLETLAALGIRFVILAPRQARGLIVDGEERLVDESSLDIRDPYRVSLPSGASMTVFFYHGALSQSIAFEGLLRDGELFWQRIAAAAKSMESPSSGNPLLCLATDGETYGHHFTFGEMALAHVLAQGRAKRENIRFTNIAAHIAANPPIKEVVLHEPSSWSCVHGVERWKSDCGCTDGGHGGWNQKWRAPLRNALNVMRDAVEAHFARAGQDCFTDADAALIAYGQVLADPEKSDSFAKKWFTGDTAAKDKAWKLLAMQEQALAAFASCAWFFDDIARIEPENAMTFALRAMDLMRESSGPDVSAAVMAELEKALSNQPEEGTGKDIFIRDVMPRRDDPEALCLLSWVMEYAGKLPQEGFPPTTCVWPNLSVELRPDNVNADRDRVEALGGKAVIRMRHEELGKEYSWLLKPPSHKLLTENAFTSLADCLMQVSPVAENKAGGIAPDNAGKGRKTSDFSRPMRDFLLTHALEAWERANRPVLRGVASHVISMSEAWHEAQRDVTRPEFWIGFLPYLLLENMLHDNLDVKLRMQLEKLLSTHLSARPKALSRLLVEETFLSALAEESDTGARSDASLAEWARRVRYIMPDMDWWAVQNRIWDKGISKYPALAAELGFKK